MNILVTGASGYIGGRLVPELLARGHMVRCLTRSPGSVEGRFPGATVVAGDVLGAQTDLVTALEGIDAAYYLVHSMTAGSDFASRDRDAARNFATGRSFSNDCVLRATRPLWHAVLVCGDPISWLYFRRVGSKHSRARCVTLGSDSGPSWR